MGESHAGQPEGVVDEVVGYGGDEPQHHQQPEALLSSGPPEPRLPDRRKRLTDVPLHPLTPQAAGEEEHEGAVEHGPQKGVDTAPDQPEQQSAGQGQHCNREKHYRQQRKEQDIACGRPGTQSG